MDHVVLCRENTQRKGKPCHMTYQAILQVSSFQLFFLLFYKMHGAFCFRGSKVKSTFLQLPAVYHIYFSFFLQLYGYGQTIMLLINGPLGFALDISYTINIKGTEMKKNRCLQAPKKCLHCTSTFCWTKESGQSLGTGAKIHT